MVCEIMRDEDFLKQVSEPAAQADIPVADDLLETADRPQGRLRGHGGEYDRHFQAHHRH